MPSNSFAFSLTSRLLAVTLIFSLSACQKKEIVTTETPLPDEAPVANTYQPIKVDSTQLKTIVPGLQLYIAKQGTGQKPKNGEQVFVQYHGRLTNGNVFDSSYLKNVPIDFPLGRGAVIRGWDLGIAQLNVGSKGVLIISPELGYGAAGSPPVIPPNSTLVFDVELVGVNAAPGQPQP
jgi:FKBP-type peptidyl-prolyl cis-trans isomerase